MTTTKMNQKPKKTNSTRAKQKESTYSLRKFASDLEKRSKQKKELLDEYVSEKTQKTMVIISIIMGTVALLPIFMNIATWNVKTFKKLKQAWKS